MDKEGLWTISRRGWLVATASLIVVAAASSAQAAASDAADVIQELDTGLIAVMKAGGTASFQQRFAMLAPVIDRTFDLTTVLRNSIGPRWDTLSDDERGQLLQAFRRYTVASYVSNFNSWSGQTFRISSDTRQVGAEAVVPTQIIPANGDSPTTLSYVLRQTPGGWRVVDVLADGSISRVAVQRSDFRSLLAGGGARALSASLERKVSTLSGGSLA